MKHKTRKKLWQEVSITTPEEFDTTIQEEYINHVDRDFLNYDNFIRYLRMKGIKYEIVF